MVALVWAVALRGHSSSPSAPSASSSPHSSSTSSPHNSSIYHGPAPGVEGLTRDIAKAHGAVGTSQKNAQALERSSRQASGEAPSSAPATTPAGSRASTGSAGGAASRSSAHGSAGAARKTNAHKTTAHKMTARKRPAARPHGKLPSTGGRPPQQLQVERELARGKTVMLVFWEPRSSVDDSVRSQALALGGSSKGKLVVHVALADQVGLFGPVTEAAHVYQTPTVLIVGRHGLITTLTGLVDRFSLQQAVREAEHANR